MKQILIIPDKNHIDECLELAAKNQLGFEYNDFSVPEVLDDETSFSEIINSYIGRELPGYNTVHGAFFDVIPFSVDYRVREIADLRIAQSIAAAKRIGARAVVFHTNYNPFLNDEKYVCSWLKKNTDYWSSILEAHPDINIYLENMFDTTPDMLEALSESLSKYPNYGVCLDYAHATLSGMSPGDWSQRLGRFVKHIHINDNDGISDLHLAWGDGRVDRMAFYECYERYMQGATVLIETTSMENIYKSLELLKREGFISG